MLSYAVLGTGAVGGYYGALLARAGAPVHFLLRGDYAWVRDHGLRVDSKDGDFRLEGARAYARPEDIPPCDVVVLALKTTDQAAARDLLARLPGGPHTVLSVQNGLGVEAELAAWPEVRKALGGLCFLCSQKVGPGHIRHLDYGAMRLGEYAPGGPAGITEAMRAMAADLVRAGVGVELAGDLEGARWAKLVWNMAFNGPSVLLDATTAELVADPDARAWVGGLMAETEAAAAACGHPLPDGTRAALLARTETMVPYDPSMKLDYRAGRPMELEAIYARPLAAAAARGLELPLTSALWRQLRFLERRRPD